MSVRKAAALAIAQLGVAAFFISGVTRTALGESAAWFVLAATVLAAFVRAIDIESWALLIPGGFVSRVTNAFGPRAAGVARAAALVERVLLGALACVVDRALRRQRVGDRHCGLALHRLCEARGSRDSGRRRRHRPALASDAHRPRYRSRSVGAGRLDRRSHSPGHASPGAWSRSPGWRCPPSLAGRPSDPGDHVMGAARHRARVPSWLRPGVAGHRWRRSAGARGPRAPATTRARRCGVPALLTVLFAGLVTTLGTFLARPAGACERTSALGECAAGRPRAAPGRAFGGASADGRGAGRCRGADPGSGGSRRDWRRRADAPSSRRLTARCRPVSRRFTRGSGRPPALST